MADRGHHEAREQSGPLHRRTRRRSGIAVPRISQAGRQLVADWEAVRPLRDRHHGRFNRSDERQRTRGIIKRDEIANLNQIGPCGR